MGQGGNEFEWGETSDRFYWLAGDRWLRGGSWDFCPLRWLQSWWGITIRPSYVQNINGFRVAAIPRPRPAPAPDLEIQLLYNPAGDLEISFDTEPGFSYTLRTTTNGIDWTDLDSTSGFGSVFTFTHSGATAGAPTRIYQVEVTTLPDS